MYSFRKSKKGFTLIELMVVVAIIAVLALLGLRMYSTQQDKSKEAIVKANAGTVQVQIQTALVDKSVSTINTALSTASSGLTDPDLTDLNALQNPFSGKTGSANTIVYGATKGSITAGSAVEGFVGVEFSDPVFIIKAFGKDGRDMSYELTAQK